jgi:hypothetical protein
MKQEELKELLERYYNGDTSPEDEIVLRDYFSGDDIFPGYEAEREIFCYYSAKEKIPAPSGDLEARIMKSIDNLEHTRSIPGRTRYIVLLSIAATFLILVGSYFFFIRNQEPKDTFSDPRIAYAETMKILNEISVKMNKGTSGLQSISKLNNAARTSMESVGRSTSMITGSFKRIEVIRKLSETDVKKNN